MGGEIQTEAGCALRQFGTQFGPVLDGDFACAGV